MKKVRFTHRFEKDMKLMERRGKSLEKIKAIIELLMNEKPLSPALQDHPLKGNWIGRRECHIENDWLLIYIANENTIVCERTYSHNDVTYLKVDSLTSRCTPILFKK